MLLLTKEAMRAMFPVAPQAVIDAFVKKQHILDKAGITGTRRRLAWFFANIEHESGGFRIRKLTENINYTHQRIAEVWPNRFSSAAQVAARFGTDPGWQKRAFDEIYGNRMGNRPGTSDGSLFIGRGGPQWTGRDGYEALARILPTLNPSIPKNLTAEQAIDYAVKHEFQPEVCTAFWVWKRMNRYADANNWVGLVRAWNGGTNGMADRNARLAGNDPHINRLEAVAQKTITIDKLPEPDGPPVIIKGDEMNSDLAWQILRYILIAVGAWFTSKGYVTGDQWETVLAAIGTLVPIVWGIFVKTGTKAVPAATAERADVPTVSGATGAIEK